MDGRIDRWTDGRTDGRMDGSKDGSVDQSMDEWIDRSMDRKWIAGSMDPCMHAPMHGYYSITWIHTHKNVVGQMLWPIHAKCADHLFFTFDFLRVTCMR